MRIEMIGQFYIFCKNCDYKQLQNFYTVDVGIICEKCAIDYKPLAFLDDQTKLDEQKGAQ